MFSGIIYNVGTIQSIEKKGDGFLWGVLCPELVPKLTVGASVANSGVCLTVYELKEDVIVFEIMPETIRKTTLGTKKIGDKLHLEPSLKLGDELGGHFVYGHVDGVGEVVSVDKEGETLLVSVKIPEELIRYMVLQGSVTIDGVSLTVARLEDTVITVSLIDLTQKTTLLGAVKEGDMVNIECDMFAKYIEKLIEKNFKK
jgi:riboflavin synthase